MTSQAVFIDLSNFYSGLIRSGLAADPKFLRSYFLEWLDLDLLANKLTNVSPNIWVFYSSGKIGPKEARLSGKFLGNYINRTNNLAGVTARDVNIPGEQREQREIAVAKCNKCGSTVLKCDDCGSEDTTSEWVSEKGVDASLTVHLFDTMDAWDIAYLLSGDADFVPVVASLRRRGMIVIGAGFPGTSSALIRECYNYTNLVDAFIREDVVLFALFGGNGVLTKWLNSIKPDPSFEPGNLTIRIGWTERGSPFSEIFINIQGYCDVEGLTEELSDHLNNLQLRFRDRVTQGRNFSFFVNSVSLVGLKRRITDFIKSIRVPYDEKDLYIAVNGYTIEYQHTEGKYEPNTLVAGVNWT